ncbi:hypothetical protein H6F89_31380 [Cyanobacteria bacterium FACHB-63]|nr:hypothetical protein [Cyanobacteria bacterium FACHB-63]
MMTTPLESISSFGWRGKLFFGAMFVLMPIVLFISIATYKFSDLSKFALISSVIFTLPLCSLKKEISQEMKRIEAQKIQEYDEQRRQRHIADSIAEKVVEKVINEGAELVFDLIAGMFGINGNVRNVSLKKMDLEKIRLQSYAEAKQMVLARRRNEVVTTKELVYGAAFVLLCQMVFYSYSQILRS